MNVSWNPAIGLPEAIMLTVLFLALGLWLSWRGSGGVSRKTRTGLTLFRAGGLGLVALIWLNPGHWISEQKIEEREWLILLDRSASMAVKQGEQTRWDNALALVEKLSADAPTHGKAEVRLFDSALAAESDWKTQTAPPSGEGTDLARTLNAALDSGGPLSGITLISDGRQTTRDSLEKVALRARGRGLPIHVVPIGREAGIRDLSLRATPRLATAFLGQPLKITAQLENRGLGPIRPTVTLHSADGKELQRQEVELPAGASGQARFELPSVTETDRTFYLRTEPWAGEQLRSNNADTVRVRTLQSKTRVLLLEGAPYWDSKFLAQLLRNQASAEIVTVHRLNAQRYFRIEEGGATPIASTDAIFPADGAALARYDLIVFGKGSEGFLDPARVTALQEFVRDHGGAVLFARGKSYSGRFPALEPLEPLEWGEPVGGRFRFTPLGSASGELFGGALPEAEAEVWQTLPLLQDSSAVARLMPFSRVFAEGVRENGDRFPLLIARRYGRGVTAAVNADGLWRWDFQPDNKEIVSLYEDFWVQLLQWCASYSEFLPGQSFAVRLRETSAEPGQPVRAVVSYRGTGQPQPFLRIKNDEGEFSEAVATFAHAADGGAEWNAVVVPSKPGHYEVTVGDRLQPALEEGRATLNVPPPQKEEDDLRPDPETLERLAAAAGGEVFEVADVLGLSNKLWGTTPQQSNSSKPLWKPLWPHTWMVLGLVLCLGGEWWWRRREGLM